MELKLNLEGLAAELWQPNRYKILWGGRGGGKSYLVADLLLLLGIVTKERILCAREIQGSIKESVHQLLKDRIEALGLSQFYTVQNDVIKGSNGTVFLFKGLKHNISTVKSMAGISRVWIEEAQTVSEESWRVLLPTIRDEGSEVWLTLNPGKRSDATSQRFLINTPDGAFIRKINWSDNPFFTEALDIERQQDKEYRPDSYAHVWEGDFEGAASSAVIPYMWIESAVGLAQDLGLDISGQRYAALDVAGAEAGGDANALALRHGISLESLTTWNGYDTSKTTRVAVKDALAFGSKDCFYDSVGVGEGVTGEWAMMRATGAAPIGMTWSAWNGGAQPLNPDRPTERGNPNSPKNKDQYANLKAQGWFALRQRFFEAHKARKGDKYDPENLISINPNLACLEVLKAELSQPEQKVSQTGKAMVDKQPDKAPSPNLADAVMMAFHPVGSGYRIVN